MLSETSSIPDMKKELETYDVYGYDKESDFQNDLEYALEIAEKDRMIPVIGENTYDSLAGQDKSGLSTTQLYVYWAEVYYSLAEFCFLHARRDKYQRRSAREGRTQGDITYTNTGATGKEMIAYDYLTKADKSFSAGGYGYAPGRLTRKTGIYDN